MRWTRMEPEDTVDEDFGRLGPSWDRNIGCVCGDVAVTVAVAVVVAAAVAVAVAVAVDVAVDVVWAVAGLG